MNDTIQREILSQPLLKLKNDHQKFHKYPKQKNYAIIRSKSYTHSYTLIDSKIRDLSHIPYICCRSKIMIGILLKIHKASLL